jgi:hypothetical protein
MNNIIGDIVKNEMECQLNIDFENQLIAGINCSMREYEASYSLTR